MARGDLVGGRCEISAEMTGDEAMEQIDETIDHEEPGKEKMPAPTSRKILVARDRCPGRKSPLVPVAVIARYAEDACRPYRKAADAKNTLRRIPVFDGADREP